MKRFLAILALLWCAPAQAQVYGHTTFNPKSIYWSGGGIPLGGTATRVCVQTADDATPSMNGSTPNGCNILLTATDHTGAVTVTGLDDVLSGIDAIGAYEQIIYVVGQPDADQTTIADGGGFVLERDWISPDATEELRVLVLKTAYMTAAVASVADGGGGTSLDVTSNAHGLAAGQTVTLSAMSVAAYDGTYVINSVAANTFNVTQTYSATATGTWAAVRFDEATRHNGWRYFDNRIEAVHAIDTEDADGTRYFDFEANMATGPAASAEVTGAYSALNWSTGTNVTATLNGLEGVARSQAADEALTLRGVYGRTYIDTDAAAGATCRTCIGGEFSARAAYGGGTEVAAESGTAFVGSRIWMAPYFSAGTVGNLNNFWGLWIYGEHASQRNADAAIKISDAGGGFTDDLILQTGTSITNDVAGNLTLQGDGASNDEDLTLDFETVADAIGFSSSTGVEEWDITSMRLHGITVPLDNASGNESAWLLEYVTNKAAGDDTGLKVRQTDTASPGASLLYDFGVGANPQMTLTNAGLLTLYGSSWTDAITWYHDETDAYQKWSDGNLILMTNEGTNVSTVVEFKPRGTSELSSLGLYDTDGQRLLLYTAADRAYIESQGGALGLQVGQVQDVLIWESIASGNPSLVLYGWNTAGSDLESTELTMDDANDEFLIQTPNSANHEGVTISLQEANQKLRLRQGSDVLDVQLDGSDAFVKWSDGNLILQTDEATNTATYVELKPKGSSEVSTIGLYDTDSRELWMHTAANRGYVQSGTGALGLQNTVVQDILMWEAIGSGNPSLILSGWNTAGSDLESTELTMDDTNDEFLIRAAASANHEGITVELDEASQLFRVRGSDGAVDFSSSDTALLVVNAATFNSNADVEGVAAIGNGSSLASNKTLVIDRDFSDTSDSEALSVVGSQIEVTAGSSDINHTMMEPGSTTFSTAATVHDYASTLTLVEPNISVQDGATVTHAATLRIVNAPTEGVTSNWALWADGGDVKVDDNLTVDGTITAGALTMAGDLDFDWNDAIDIDEIYGQAPTSDTAPNDTDWLIANAYAKATGGSQTGASGNVRTGIGSRYVTFNDFANSAGDIWRGVIDGVGTPTYDLVADTDFTCSTAADDAECALNFKTDFNTQGWPATASCDDGTCTNGKVYLQPDDNGIFAFTHTVVDAGGGAMGVVTSGADGSWSVHTVHNALVVDGDGNTTVAGTMSASVGVIGAPGYILGTDTNTGWYSDADGTWRYSSNDTEVFALAGTGVFVNSGKFALSSGVSMDVASNTILTWNNDLAIGRSAAGKFLIGNALLTQALMVDASINDVVTLKTESETALTLKVMGDGILDAIGASVNSPALSLRGDDGGTEVEGTIQLAQGAQPYLFFSVDDDSATPVLTQVLHLDDVSIRPASAGGIALGSSTNYYTSTFSQQLNLMDTGNDHYLTIAWNEDNAANAQLRYVIGGDDDHTLTIDHDFTVEAASLINQDLTSDSTAAQFDDLTLTDDLLLADGAVIGITGNEVITFDAAGTVTVSGATLSVTGNNTKGALTTTFTKTESVTFNNDAAKTTVGEIFEGGIFLTHVTGRVTTALAGCTSVDVGDGVDVDIFIAGLAVAQNTTFDGDDVTASFSNPIISSTCAGGVCEITVTANGGNCTAGVIALTAHGFDATAATAN